MCCKAYFSNADGNRRKGTHYNICGRAYARITGSPDWEEEVPEESRRRRNRGTALPTPGFYLTVRVKVGAQVAMTAKTAAGVVAKQQHHEHAERMLLERGAGVTGAAPFVNAAFVADADTVGVMPTGVRAGELYRAQGLYIAVLADIKMVACAGEAPAQVVCCQVIFRIAAVAARGGTVDNKEVDESHGIRQA